MNIALLNISIEIQKNVLTVDNYGNHVNSWMPYLLCHATVSSESPAEKSDAGLILDDSRLDFTIRWFSSAAVIKSTGYRVIFNDEIYAIIGVDHMNYKRRSMKLLCQKVSR